MSIEDGYIFTLTAIAIFLLAGTIKGAIGIGLPTTAMSLMLLVFEPYIAIGLVILPIVITNGQQYFTMPDKRATAKRYWLFAACAMVTIFLVSVYALEFSIDYLRLIIAIAILLFCLTQFLKIRIRLVETHDRFSQVLFGILSGICGGLTSIWAPPIMIYTLSRGVKKEEFISAAGFLIFVTSLPLLGGLTSAGFINEEIFMISLICVAASMTGFVIGARIRRYINERTFKFILLGFFTVAGLRLLVTELHLIF